MSGRTQPNAACESQAVRRLLALSVDPSAVGRTDGLHPSKIGSPQGQGGGHCVAAFASRCCVRSRRQVWVCIPDVLTWISRDFFQFLQRGPPAPLKHLAKHASSGGSFLGLAACVQSGGGQVRQPIGLNVSRIRQRHKAARRETCSTKWRAARQRHARRRRVAAELVMPGVCLFVAPRVARVSAGLASGYGNPF